MLCHNLGLFFRRFEVNLFIEHQSLITVDSENIACKKHLIYTTTSDYVTTVHIRFCLQCFDAVGWATGRASGL